MDEGITMNLMDKRKSDERKSLHEHCHNVSCNNVYKKNNIS